MVYVAGILALLLVFAVQTGTRYVLNDWTKDKLERFMSINLHRKVNLGRTTWSLGLNGLVIATDKMYIADRIGDEPFITSEFSQIGVPLLPMLAGDMEARYVTLTHPKLYAVKIGKFTWNFSDLPDVDALKNIAYLDMQNGELHVIDKSNDPPALWSPRIFTSANFHLERPFQNRTWPFTLAFEMPHLKYRTKVLLTGIGNGNIHDWADNNHQFDLKADNINLNDFSDIFVSLPNIQGMLNLEVHGEGVPRKGFNVNAVIKSPSMTVEAPGVGTITIKNGVTSGQFVANEDQFNWTNVVVKLGPQLSLQTSGRMLNWKTKKPSYEGTVVASTNDLNKLAKLLPAALLPRQLLPPRMVTRIAHDRHRLINISQALAPAKLTGSIAINAKFRGTGKKTNIWADLTARDILISQLAQLRPFQDNPVIGILGANPRARLNLRMSVVPEGRSQISAGEIVLGRSRITLTGYMLMKENIAHIKYFSRNLNLAEVTPVGRNSAAQQRLNRILGLPQKTRFSLTGLMDIDGTLDTHGDKQTMHVVSQVHNAGLALNNGQLRATRVNGGFVYDGSTVTIGNLNGYVNNGPFRLNGKVSSLENGPVNISYQGKTLELSAVKALASAMDVNSPLLNNKYLRGRIDNVVLVVTGTNRHPVVNMTGNPRDITFQPPGTPGALRIIGGYFQIANNVATFKEVRGSLGRGTFMLSGSASASGSNIVLAGRNIDISEFRTALIALAIDSPVITGPQVLFGRMHDALLVIRTAGKTTQFSLSGSPASVYYQPKGMPRTFLLTGGRINVTESLAVMHGLRGQLGTGTFTLNGRMSLKGNNASDIAFDGRNLDLSHVKAALQALDVKSPLLAQQVLYGKVHRLVFTMKGETKSKTPNITLIAYPADVRFEPIGSKRTMRVVSGVVTYANDTLTAKDLAVVNARSRVLITLRIEDLSKHSRFADLHLRTRDLDLGDLSSYLASNTTPTTVRQPYLELLKTFGLKEIRGNIAGTIDYTAARPDHAMTVGSDLDIRNVSFNLRGISFAGINGRIGNEGDNIVADNIRGTLDQNPVHLNMVVHGARSGSPTWSGELASHVNLPRLLAMMPGDNNFQQIIHATEDIPIRVGIFGTPDRTAFVFTGTISGASGFSIQAPIGIITKPANTAVQITALMVYRQEHPALLRFYDSHMDVGETRVAWNGDYAWPATAGGVPTIDFNFSIPRPMMGRNLLALLPSPQLEPLLNEMTGRISGDLHVFGPLTTPVGNGKVHFHDISIPSLNISHVTGTISGPQTAANLQLDLQSLSAGKITFRDIEGNIISENTPEGRRFTFDQVTASIYGGTATLNGNVIMNSTRPFTIDAGVADLNMDQLLTEEFGAHGEVTGLLSANATIAGNASDRSGNTTAIVRSLTGSGRFDISEGRIKRFGQLHSALQKLNLLQEGIFGLNVNNFLAAIAGVETGAFHSFSGNFGVSDAVLTLNQLSFVGDELRLRGEGQMQLETQDVRVQIAGNIPRVAKGILKGPLGAFLQHLTIGNLLHTATFGILDKFPELPVLGKLGTDRKPRAFEFVAAGNLQDPNTFTQSIMKSFHWLPNERNATPYPVFGVGAQPEAIPQ